jgi:tricorn protease
MTSARRLAALGFGSLLALALVLSLLISPSAAAADAGSGTRLLQTPTVSDTQIAFAYAQNIWVVPRAGGLARRLTTFQGLTSNPHFSPDGKWIAFSGEYAGNVDVYVIPAEGGEPRRLTWHPTPDLVQGWTPDGKSILFSSTRDAWAPSAVPRFFTVSMDGGLPQPMKLPRGYQGKISPDGTHIAYRMNNSWDEQRRNYRGGQNRPIWIVDLKTFDIVSPPWTDSKDMDPAWVGQTVYFISDRDSVANVWSYNPGTKQLAQVTHFTDFDVKSLDSDRNTIVFEQAGYIHELDPATGREHIVNITATGDFPWMLPHWEDVTARMADLSLSPTGKRILVDARGEVFTIPADKGDVRDLTHSSGSAEIDPAWSPDGKYISYFSDKSGEYQLVIEAQDGITPPRMLPLETPKHYYMASWSPDSKKIAYTDTDLKIWVMDVATGKAKVVGHDPWMVPRRTENPVWSPDSTWIAYSAHLQSLYHAIYVANVDTGESHQVTDGLADAVWPVWDASGKYLWFLASTDYGLGSQWLDMTSYDHNEHFGLYLAVLNKAGASPLLPQSDEDQGIHESSPQAAAAIARSTGPITIDFAGVAQRIIAVPGLPPRQYEKLVAGAPGTVFYLESAEGGGPGGDTLNRYQLSTRRAEAFARNVADYAVSADGKKLVYRVNPRGAANAPAAQRRPPELYLVEATGKAPDAGKGRIAATLRMYLDPKAEFTQIFNEGWRNQRDYLYVKNMHGTDWVKDKAMYGAMLPYVMHRADLNYLLDMMGAEIAIGHSFVRGGDMPEVPPIYVGLLGADFSIENGRYRVSRIYDTESWNPDLHAPLATPGVTVQSGDYILAINGQPLQGTDNIYRLLDGTADQQTVITVNRTPSTTGARDVTVVPVRSEQALRTRAWVESNRRLVDKLSGGKLAYVYLPNTAQGGYESFNRYYFSQQEKQGAIIDERYNSGGSAADYIIDVLQRTFDGYFNNVAGDRVPFTSPEAGIWGPKVMIANEMSGSGGDFMPWMFKHRKIGLLVGKRTWGGLVHTADTPPFVDGGSMIAPRGGFFDADGHWAVENTGTSPDIDVEDWPKDVIAGHDAQLERAVEEAMQELKAHPPTRMMHEPPPPTWGARKKPTGTGQQ